VTAPTNTSEQTRPGAPVGLDDITLHLVALGAAVASNAERAFQAHHAQLVELGASKEDMIQAVNIALRVKGDPHQMILGLAEASLVEGGGGGCCGDACACEAEGKEKGACGDDCAC
jgi:hypothetical protein